MRNRFLSCLASSFVFLASTAFAAGESPTPPALPFAHEGSDLKPDPAVKWGRLENGVRYALMANAQPKGRASLRFGVMAGSLNETDAQQGLAHFLEHLAFNGSAHFPPGTLVEYFQRLGMSFGGDTNAGTSFDRTVYQLELPDTRSATLDSAFTLFGDFAGGLLLKPESIEKERGIILSELRDSDSQAQRTWRARTQFETPLARFASRVPIGIPEIIQKAQRDQFADFYDTWYRPESMVVVAVGDFDVAKVEAQLIKALSPIKARAPSRPRPDPGTIAPLDAPVAKFHHQPEAAAVSVSIDLVLPHAPLPDMAVRHLEDLPLEMAMAMVTRRFGILAKQEGATITGGRMQVSDAFDLMRSGGVDVICREDARWRDCLMAAEQQMRMAAEYGFRPEELAEIVANVRNGLKQSVAQAGTRNSSQLAEGLVGSIISRQVFTSPEADFVLLGPALARVTVEQCAEALRKFWNSGSGRYLFVSGNLQMSDRDILTAYTASLAQPVKKLEKQAAQSFAYAATAKPGEIAQRKHIDDLDVTTVEFKNGVRLNLKPTAFEAGRIAINLRLGGGLLSAPRDKPGLPQLVSSTFVPGGLGKHSVDDLRSLLAGKTLDYRFGVGSDAFELGGGTTPDDLLLQLQVLRAFVTDPGYRPEALRQFRKGVEESYQQATHSLSAAQGMQVPRLLANGDERFGVPENKQVLLDRTYDEARQWMTPQLEHGALEIAMVGDFDLEKAIVAVAQTFGTLPPRELKPAYTSERQVSFPSEPITKQYKVSTELQRALVSIHWPATDRSDVSRARRMSVLARIFSDRLRLTLREKMGQTYSPGVQDQLSDTFPGFGYIVANASVAPARARAVADAIKEVAGDLSRTGITEDELKRAKEPTLAHVRDSLRDNGYWLGVVAEMQEFPQRLEWHRGREADFNAISVADINSLAKQYLDPKRASEFISTP
ncbi:MAG: insulinase family protein [Gammaproteobacteria bacterium]